MGKRRVDFEIIAQASFLVLVLIIVLWMFLTMTG